MNNKSCNDGTCKFNCFALGKCNNLNQKDVTPNGKCKCKGYITKF